MRNLIVIATAENKFEIEGFILEFNPTGKTITTEKDGEKFNFVREE